MVIAEVERSGLVESRHRGSAVLLDPDGTVARSWGDMDTVIFPRSSNKPFQALGMLRCGLGLDDELLALASSSHSAEAFHLAGVRTILARAGLDESALQTPASYPLEGWVHAEVLRGGGTRQPIYMDCSGKHAAMLLTSVTNGWPIDTYLAPGHPLQQAITETFSELTGQAPPVVGVDGCGAPLLATTLPRLARAISLVAQGGPGSDEARLVTAMTAHPQYVSGTRRPEAAFMREVAGLVGKSGAEAVYVAALADGRALAVKIEDGSERPLWAVAGRILELAGIDVPAVHERPVVLGGGRPVGTVRVTF